MSAGPARRLWILAAALLVAAVLVAVALGGFFFLWSTGNLPWRSRSGRDLPRYAPDGRGFYYQVEFSRGQDEYEYEVYYQADIDSDPVAVSETSAGMPPEVGEVRRLEDEPNFFPDDDRLGSYGPYRIDLPETLNVRVPTPLIIVDTRDGSRRKLKPWRLGILEGAYWIDEHTVLAAVDFAANNSARIDLVDTRTGELTNVLRVKGQSDEYPAEVGGRFIADPEGFVLFTVDRDDKVDRGSKLYRFDIDSRTARQIGSLRDSDNWDYSPTRNMLLETRGVNSEVFERPLPSSD